MFPPKPKTTAELQLIKDNDGLRTELICLRRELSNKEGYAGRLEVLLRERMERIDELNATVEQLRERVKRLDEENERLAQIVSAGGAVARPQRDATIHPCESERAPATMTASTTAKQSQASSAEIPNNGPEVPLRPPPPWSNMDATEPIPPQ